MVFLPLYYRRSLFPSIWQSSEACSVEYGFSTWRFIVRAKLMSSLWKGFGIVPKTFDWFLIICYYPLDRLGPGSGDRFIQNALSFWFVVIGIRFFAPKVFSRNWLWAAQKILCEGTNGECKRRSQRRGSLLDASALPWVYRDPSGFQMVIFSLYAWVKIITIV